ncbi:hypothetical protein K1719_042338 [Acacia pycnantha]|nr:hypothetical protein K1719_042338 [Acacia pycnantha]
MAPPPTVSVSSSEPPKLHASDIGSIKAFADANGLPPIPSSYYSIVEARDDVVNHLASSYYSIVVSPCLRPPSAPRQRRLPTRQGLCQMGVTNHGISEKLMEEVMNKAHKFHNLSVEEKKEFGDKGPWAPIRHGTSFSPQAEKVHYWRD